MGEYSIRSKALLEQLLVHSTHQIEGRLAFIASKNTFFGAMTAFLGVGSDETRNMQVSY